MKKLILLIMLTSVGVQTAQVHVFTTVDGKEIRIDGNNPADRAFVARNSRRDGTNKIIQTRGRKSALRNGGATQDEKKSVTFNNEPQIHSIDTSYDDDDFENQMQQFKQPSMVQLLWHFIKKNKWKIGGSIAGLCLLGYLIKKMRSK